MSGPVENPHANTWQIVERLVQNAFFKAILPFERGGYDAFQSVETGRPDSYGVGTAAVG